MIGDFCAVTGQCQQIRGEHITGHFYFTKSTLPPVPVNPYTDIVTVRISWPGDFVEEKHIRGPIKRPTRNQA